METDHISREAAIEMIKKERAYVGAFTFEESRGWSLGFRQAISFALADLAELPSADVREVKRGRWITRRFSENIYGEECSVCHTTWDAPTNYCPNCGAQMEDGE